METEFDLDGNSERRKLQTVFRRCCTDQEWKYLISCANFTKVFLQMRSVDDFQAVCETAANLLNTAAIPRMRAEIESRLLECRDQLDRELQREGFRLPETRY